jgi:hypothetical protein
VALTTRLCCGNIIVKLPYGSQKIKGEDMPTVVQRTTKDGSVKERKFKKFKITLDFTDKNDAMDFANAVNDIAPQVAAEIVLKANR